MKEQDILIRPTDKWLLSSFLAIECGTHRQPPHKVIICPIGMVHSDFWYWNPRHAEQEADDVETFHYKLDVAGPRSNQTAI